MAYAIKTESLSNTGDEVRNGVGSAVGGGMGLRESQVARLLVGGGELLLVVLLLLMVAAGCPCSDGTLVYVDAASWSSPP